MIKEQITDGLKWRALQQLIVQAFNFIILIVLNRLLDPDIFGVLGMSMVVFGFIELLRDFGLGSALINEKKADQAYLSTLFWTNMLLSVVLALILWLFSGWGAHFFRIPLLADIYKVLAVFLVINGLLLVPKSLLLKEMKFKRLFLLQLIVVLISGSVAISWALSYGDVWSLIIRFGLGSVISLLLLMIWEPWWPSIIWQRSNFKNIWAYSSPLLLSNMINYFIRNIDDVLIGRFLGSVSLGLYGRAYSLMQFPVKQISGPFVSILFPAFSKLSNEPDRIASIYLRVTRAIVFVSLPIMIILFFQASAFIQLLLGQEWLGVVPILQIFCVLGVTQSVGTLSGIIFMSTAKTRLQLRIDILTKSIVFVLIIWGLSYGLHGVALGYTLGSCISIFIYLATIGNVLQVRWMVFWTNFRESLLIGLVLSIVLLLFQQVSESLSPLIQFLGGTSLGIIVYFGLHHIIKTEVYQDLSIQYHNYRTKA